MGVSYSLMLLAATKEFGSIRTSDYRPPPKWLDIIALMRNENTTKRESHILSP